MNTHRMNNSGLSSLSFYSPVLHVCCATLLLFLGFTFTSEAAYGQELTEFMLPNNESGPMDIALGPDEKLWFTQYHGDRIGRISTAGEIEEFDLPGEGSRPAAITRGPDGAMWFTQDGRPAIGRITVDGEVDEYALPPGSVAMSLGSGPEDGIWITDAGRNAVLRLGLGGALDEFPIPSVESNPYGIVAGPDGNMWFALRTAGKVAKITPRGDITEYDVPTPSAIPTSLTVGYDGNVWFTEFGVDQIARITPDGEVTEFPTPSPLSGPLGIARGPEGTPLWITYHTSSRIATITPAGVYSYEVPTESVQGGPYAIAMGADGNMWFTEFFTNKIVRFRPSNIVSIPDSSPLPDGVEGKWYSYTLSGLKGAPPYSFRMYSGNLPPGLTLRENGSIDGIPLVPGRFMFSAEVQDANLVSASTGLRITIVPAPVEEGPNSPAEDPVLPQQPASPAPPALPEVPESTETPREVPGEPQLLTRWFDVNGRRGRPGLQVENVGTAASKGHEVVFYVSRYRSVRRKRSRKIRMMPLRSLAQGDALILNPRIRAFRSRRWRFLIAQLRPESTGAVKQASRSEVFTTATRLKRSKRRRRR